MLSNLIVGVLAGWLNTFIVGVICSPIVFAFSLGIKREYSLNFWLRSIVLGQILFWGGLILDASASPYGYIKGAEDIIRVVFNFLISVPATALMIRTAMRFKKSKNARPSETVDPKDKLDDVFNAFKNTKSVAGKIGKISRK